MADEKMEATLHAHETELAIQREIDRRVRELMGDTMIQNQARQVRIEFLLRENVELRAKVAAPPATDAPKAGPA